MTSRTYMGAGLAKNAKAKTLDERKNVLLSFTVTRKKLEKPFLITDSNGRLI